MFNLLGRSLDKGASIGLWKIVAQPGRYGCTVDRRDEQTSKCDSVEKMVWRMVR
jgi:hypothetical protein